MTDLPNPNQLVWLDIVLLLAMILSLGLGLVRGLLREVLSLGSWIVSGWLAYLYGDDLAGILTTWLESEKLSLLISFVVVFLAAIIGFSLVGSMILKLFRVSGLTGLDRSLGGLFGLSRGVVVITLMLFVADFTPLPEKPWARNSSIVPLFQLPLHWLKARVNKNLGSGSLSGTLPGLDSNQEQ